MQLHKIFCLIYSMIVLIILMCMAKGIMDIKEADREIILIISDWEIYEDTQ